MNKLKTSIQALRGYLKGDSKGLGLLDEVSRIANDMRKRLATAEEALESVSRRHAELAGAIGVDRSRCNELKEALDESRRACAGLRASEARVRAELAECQQRLQDDPVAVSGDAWKVTPQLMKDVFQATRSRFPRCPEPVLEVIASKIDSRNMMGLGLLVATHALFNLPFRVGTETTVANMRLTREEQESVLRPFVWWSRRRFDTTDWKTKLLDKAMLDP